MTWARLALSQVSPRKHSTSILLHISADTKSSSEVLLYAHLHGKGSLFLVQSLRALMDFSSLGVKTLCRFALNRTGVAVGGYDSEGLCWMDKGNLPAPCPITSRPLMGFLSFAFEMRFLHFRINMVSSVWLGLSSLQNWVGKESLFAPCLASLGPC